MSIAQEFLLLFEICGIGQKHSGIGQNCMQLRPNYFKPIILEFKTFIYDSNNKIMYIFLHVGEMLPSVGRKYTPPEENSLDFLFLGRTL